MIADPYYPEKNGDSGLGWGSIILIIVAVLLINLLVLICYKRYQKKENNA